MNDLAKNLLNEYGDIGIVLIIVAVVVNIIFIMWIKLALEEEKSKYSKELEELKSEINIYKQELEHSHQISQITYQRLFEKKIEIYDQLNKKISLFNRDIYDDNLGGEFIGYDSSDFLDIYITVFYDIKSIIDMNHLYLSIGLLEAYGILKDKVQTFDSELINVDFYYPLDNQSISDQILNNEEKKRIIYQKIYENSWEEWKNFLEKLDLDILKIKEKINLD
ncbi:MAG: Unknown protein [uncultured Sulfurovum sp.]|uniref:Uncharacterized protein n=1 Tax=uncultured Sulfurovum sp. TaxID=269237 RepID=A0A6S6U2G6_9BACT|nr:MAG: Unknown protein [uncultured Sulfurovum sp.]